MITIVRVIIFFCFVIPIINGNNEEGSLGSSTTVEEELHKCELCELKKLANELVLLMTAEDISGGDLADYHPVHMEEFYNYAIHIVATAAFGDGETELSVDARENRLDYFSLRVNNVLMELIEKACNDHYNYRFYYYYDEIEQTIFIKEILRSQDCSNCLCNLKPERSYLTSPLRIPSPKRPERTFTYVWAQNQPIIDINQPGPSNAFDLPWSRTSATITAYHIIPLPLISRFFRVWLADNPFPHLPHNGFVNDCLHTLFLRLRRSLQKILLVSMKKTQAYSNVTGFPDTDDHSFSNEEVTLQTLRDSVSWLSGNIFIAPVERGPFQPTFRREGEQLLFAFEYEAEELIEKHHYKQLLALFNELIDYINQAPNLNRFERLARGFHIFTTMTLRFQNSLTDLNGHRWTKKIVTLADLIGVVSDRTINDMINKMFWTVKKKSRKERSIGLYNYYLLDESLNYQVTSVHELKRRWSEFIFDTMRVLMDARMQNVSLQWSCNFTTLYDTYLFHVRRFNFNGPCNTCLSFDEYLYSKIRDLEQWNNCNFEKESINKIEWCTSWRRIKIGLNQSWFIYKQGKSMNYALYALKSFSKDIGTILHWLLITNEKVHNFNSSMVTLPEHPFQHLSKTTSSVNFMLCLTTTLIPSILTMQNHCKKLMR